MEGSQANLAVASEKAPGGRTGKGLVESEVSEGDWVVVFLLVPSSAGELFTVNLDFA